MIDYVPGPSLDWTKPIETVPDVRNPVAMPCRVVGEIPHGEWKVHIIGKWFPHGDSLNTVYAWDYSPDGTSNSWLPVLRNVENCDD